MDTIKVLSVRQPWAWFIARGSKRIENRNGPTKYRGRLYIHASLYPGQREYADGVLGALELMASAGAIAEATAANFEPPRPTKPATRPPLGLPCGGIVAVCSLMDCLPEDNPLMTQDPWAEGPWCWLLADVQPVPFVACKGKLGVWNAPCAWLHEPAAGVCVHCGQAATALRGRECVACAPRGWPIPTFPT